MLLLLLVSGDVVGDSDGFRDRKVIVGVGDSNKSLTQQVVCYFLFDATVVSLLIVFIFKDKMKTVVRTKITTQSPNYSRTKSLDRSSLMQDCRLMSSFRPIPFPYTQSTAFIITTCSCCHYMVLVVTVVDAVLTLFLTVVL